MNSQANSYNKRLDPAQLAPIASQIVERLEPDMVLAYGGFPDGFIRSFRPNHKVTLQAYKPQVESSQHLAVPSDVVLSIDYLNNAGALKVHDALDDLKRVTLRAGFFYVGIPEFATDLVTGYSVPRPSNWWLQEFMKRFEVHTFQRLPGGLYAIVYPLVEEVIH